MATLINLCPLCRKEMENEQILSTNKDAKVIRQIKNGRMCSDCIETLQIKKSKLVIMDSLKRQFEYQFPYSVIYSYDVIFATGINLIIELNKIEHLMIAKGKVKSVKNFIENI